MKRKNKFEYIVNDDCLTITRFNDNIECVKIPKHIDGIEVINIGKYTFDLNKSLKKIIIPNTVKSIGAGSFRECSKLNEITIPKTVIDIALNSFHCCFALKTINNIKLMDGINIINNNFIYYYTRVYKIKYQINSDYCCYDHYYKDDFNYFIDDKHHFGLIPQK